MSSSSQMEEELFKRIPKDATLQCSTSISNTPYGNHPLASLTSGKLSIPIGPSTRLPTHTHHPFLIVGRQATIADLRIDHKSISRKHAILYYWHGDLYLEDLETKKGTKINGQSTTAGRRIRLEPNDTIQFGMALPIFTLLWDKKDREKEGQQQQNDEIKTDDGNLKSRDADLHHEPRKGATEGQCQQSSDTVDEKRTIKELTDKPSKQLEVGETLSGRAKREAEIAAMMASLDDAPTFTKYVPTKEELEVEQQSAHKGRSAEAGDGDHHKQSLWNTYKLPLAECLEMEQIPTITCLALDPSGARFAVGSTDTNLRLFDFGGMNPLQPLPFAVVTVEDGYPVRAVCYSANGDRILVATGSSQPKILDRDGQELLQFVRGDVYVTDPTRTVGHTAAVTCVAWHPLEKSIVVTGSLDGSVRWWDVDKGKLQFSMLTCSTVVCIKSSKGRKTAVTCIAFAPGGREIAVGTECGSVQVWNPTQSKLRPLRAVYPEGIVSAVDSLVYNADGTLLASRSAQSCCIWNPQKLSKSSRPVIECQNVGLDEYSKSETTTIAFSPNGKILCVGITDQNQKTSCLKFFSTSVSTGTSAVATTSRPARLVEYPLLGSGGIVAVQWHFKLNQLLVANRKLYVLYDVNHSKKGALLTTATTQQRRRIKGGESDLQQLYESRAPKGTYIRGEIITPNALPLFQTDAGHKMNKQHKRKRQEEENKNASRIPEPPAKGFKAGGQSSTSATFTQFVVDSTLPQKPIAGKDPREALFQYKEGKNYISTAYVGNKEVILADKTVEEDEEELKKSRK